MKIPSLALATAALAFSLPLQAADPYMTVYAWDPGCQHTVETNNFDLAPGAAVEIQVDLTQCSPAQLAGLLVHGYAPRNSGSDALTRRHNVRLRVVSDAGLDVFSDEGYVFTQIRHRLGSRCWPRTSTSVSPSRSGWCRGAASKPASGRRDHSRRPVSSLTRSG